MTKTVVFATRLVRVIARLVVVHVVRAYVFTDYWKVSFERLEGNLPIVLRLPFDTSFFFGVL